MVAIASLMKNQQVNSGSRSYLTALYGIETLLGGTPERLSNACVTQYQALLLTHSQVQFVKPTTIHPATLLPGEHPQVLIQGCHRMKR